MRKNTLITGASSGLGAGMARILAERGHNLALTARRLDRLEGLRDELIAANPNIAITVHQLDVNQHDDVFTVFDEIAAELGGIDRVIVNAGIGKGARIGSGGFSANRDTAETNFIAALAQIEAAMAHFYDRQSGHLVLISSMSAMRGLPSSMTTYAATKAALAHVAEGIRLDLLGKKGLDITVTTLYPGYIESEMSAGVAQDVKLMVDTETGTRAMVEKIEKEVTDAAVPPWPWAPLSPVMKFAPLRVIRQLV